MLFLIVPAVAAARQIPDPADAAERASDGPEFGSISWGRGFEPRVSRSPDYYINYYRKSRSTSLMKPIRPAK
jgi:hypothetical protein